MLFWLYHSFTSYMGVLNYRL